MREDQSFGQRLRQVRLHAGLSQSGLEERSGIPKARLSRYENGHVLPSIGTLGKLARALGVSEAALLGDQRAILEEFFDALLARGVVLHSAEQARKLAGAVADMYESMGLPVAETNGEPDLATASIVDVTEAPEPSDLAPI